MSGPGESGAPPSSGSSSGGSGGERDSNAPKTTLNRAAQLLENNTDLALDIATNATTLRTRTPWDVPGMPLPRTFGRDDEVLCARWMAEEWGEDVRIDVVRNAAHAVSVRRRFDSMTEWAASQVWDGTKRLYLLPSLLGLKDDDVTQAAVRDWMIACARRWRTPGAPLEDILLVESAPSVRATAKAIASLLPDRPILDVGMDFDTRASSRRMVGKALFIFSDFAYPSAQQAEVLAGFCARVRDEEDMPARRHGAALIASEKREEVPTRCVPTQAVSAPEPLDVELARHLVAEALALEAEAGFARGRASVRRAREEAWEVPVQLWISMHRFEIAEAGYVAVSKILRDCLRIPTDKWQVSSHQRVARILYDLGFTKDRLRVGPCGEKLSVWVPPTHLTVDHEVGYNPTSRTSDSCPDVPTNEPEINTLEPDTTAVGTTGRNSE